MDDLFTAARAAAPAQGPLADRMRPRTLDEFIGQKHIVGPGKLLRRAIEADRLTSSIFWGPPGCGKTTLASIIAETTRSDFVSSTPSPAAYPTCGKYCAGRRTPR